MKESFDTQLQASTDGVRPPVLSSIYVHLREIFVVHRPNLAIVPAVCDRFNNQSSQFHRKFRFHQISVFVQKCLRMSPNDSEMSSIFFESDAFDEFLFSNRLTSTICWWNVLKFSLKWCHCEWLKLISATLASAAAVNGIIDNISSIMVEWLDPWL